jgi:ERO1-like protein alpha
MSLLFPRFDPDLTKNQGPFWLRNVYFVYLMELRAIAKAAPVILATNFEFENAEEDKATIESVKKFFDLVKSFPDHFDESGMFAGGTEKVGDSCCILGFYVCLLSSSTIILIFLRTSKVM